MKADAKQVTFRGLDKPVLPSTPEFIKALYISHAMDGESMIAWSMNGTDLPFLNGYPIRLVVPGYFGTYWVKLLSEVEVVDHTYDCFFMAKGYRVPDNDCFCVAPVTTSAQTQPISKIPVRSFTIVKHGDVLRFKKDVELKGITFGGGVGVNKVEVSIDGGQSWREAKLGVDLGRFSFREWTLTITFTSKGATQLMVRASNRAGETKPLRADWNPEWLPPPRHRNQPRDRRLRESHMKRMTILLCAAQVCLAVMASAAPLSITLPSKTAVFTPNALPRYPLAQQKCSTCHSADYINFQPPGMSLVQWTGETSKMQHEYGAPISDQDVSIIGAYLAATYGSAHASDADVQAASNPSAGQTLAVPAAKVDAMALLQSNTSLSCHAIDHKVVGPAYHDVAAKYANDPQALAKITSSIQHGGTGKWGDIPMPPFTQLSPDDLQTLATFVLYQ